MNTLYQTIKIFFWSFLKVGLGPKQPTKAIEKILFPSRAASLSINLIKSMQIVPLTTYIVCYASVGISEH